jgi:hypothetical protein
VSLGKVAISESVLESRSLWFYQVSSLELRGATFKDLARTREGVTIAEVVKRIATREI